MLIIKQLSDLNITVKTLKSIYFSSKMHGPLAVKVGCKPDSCSGISDIDDIRVNKLSAEALPT